MIPKKLPMVMYVLGIFLFFAGIISYFYGPAGYEHDLRGVIGGMVFLLLGYIVSQGVYWQERPNEASFLNHLDLEQDKNDNKSEAIETEAEAIKPIENQAVE